MCEVAPVRKLEDPCAAVMACRDNFFAYLLVMMVEEGTRPVSSIASAT